MSESTRKAVVLVSGGMDSAVTLALAREQGFACHALSVDYGQRHLSELEAAGLPAQAAQFCADGRARAAAVEEANRVADQQASFLTPEDEDYPGRLLEIYDPPPVLWVRGDTALLNRPGIAVVGTRQPTPYGSGMAEMLSRELARRRPPVGAVSQPVQAQLVITVHPVAQRLAVHPGTARRL